MYGHDNDETGELPRFDPYQSRTFDQHPVRSTAPVATVS